MLALQQLVALARARGFCAQFDGRATILLCTIIAAAASCPARLLSGRTTFAPFRAPARRRRWTSAAKLAAQYSLGPPLELELERKQKQQQQKQQQQQQKGKEEG